ncbi:MAG TPA: glycosyltransferase family 4 protein [Casimicrobiaceae bacterium]|nr:glycosyltransferase family 4 protein [Casimicrobiaceae bacterium]
MRLALIRQRYTPFGGAERFVENAFEALLERNVAITLYARQWPETRLKLIEPVIVNPFFIGRTWRDWGFARAVSREVSRAKIDIVQSHERLTTCDVYRAGDGVHAVWLDERLKDAGWWARTSVALSPWHRYTLAAERKLFASPLLQAVICNSTMVRDELVERFAVPPEKLRVIVNAVDTQQFSPALRSSRAATRNELRIADDATVFLFIGSGFERKGVATAIEALATLPPTACLVVVGRDKSIDRYRSLARRLGVADRVLLVGPRIDVKPYLGAADAFVLPTIYDPLPNAALEAMACALPVVTTVKSGVAPLLRERGAGFVVASRDAAALGEKMRVLLDAPLRERMGANARDAVLPLTPEAMTLALVLLYKELLEGSALKQKQDAERKLRAHYEAWDAKVGAQPKKPVRPDEGPAS